MASLTNALTTLGALASVGCVYGASAGVAQTVHRGSPSVTTEGIVTGIAGFGSTTIRGNEPGSALVLSLTSGLGTDHKRAGLTAPILFGLEYFAVPESPRQWVGYHFGLSGGGRLREVGSHDALAQLTLGSLFRLRTRSDQSQPHVFLKMDFNIGPCQAGGGGPGGLAAGLSISVGAMHIRYWHM